MRATYFRKIDLWVDTTGVEKSHQVTRLFQKLSGEAFDEMEHLDTRMFKGFEAIEEYKKAIDDVYEPVEDHRVGKVMDEFLDDFASRKGQEIIDYNLSWQKELAKAEKVAGQLTDKWKAHLYLKKLEPEQKSQVLTGALGRRQP